MILHCFLYFLTLFIYFFLYKLRIVDPPVLPLEKKPNSDGDGPDIEPNLWMWVNPNIVYPPGKLEVSDPTSVADETSEVPCPQPPLEKQDHSPPRKQKRKQSFSWPAPLPFTRCTLEWRLQPTISPEGRLWSRPPLNYFHLIALALSNSPPCGLNVQQIYSFTRYVPGFPHLGLRMSTLPGQCVNRVPTGTHRCT
uniref:Forkhead box R1 n=1 Tax=Cavia porcellus TaxID=10141 RepID=H0UX74_CAVPO